MQKFSLLFVLALFLCVPLLSAADIPQKPALLNKISYQLTLEKWATTNTAKVTVSVDAALDKLALSSAHNEIMQKLSKIAGNNAEWHITQFVRSQDKSGLEQLHVEAEARIDEANLGGLRENAKAISKQGETYTISAIEFSPSLAEIEQAHAAARSAIYEGVKGEIARLNQVYPDQHYFLYSITFAPAPSESPGIMTSRMTLAAVPGPAGASPMAVSAKVVETATVVIASQSPEQALVKIAG